MQSLFQDKVSPPLIHIVFYGRPLLEIEFAKEIITSTRSILLQPYVRRYRIFFFKILPMRNERKLGMARWRVTDVFNNSILLLRLSKFAVRFFS